MCPALHFYCLLIEHGSPNGNNSFRQGVHTYADRPELVERIEGTWVQGLLGRYYTPMQTSNGILYTYMSDVISSPDS